MANKGTRAEVKPDTTRNRQTREGDVATEAELARLEAITGGADVPEIYDSETEEQLNELDASTEEEIDALRVNLMQDDAVGSADGSGRVIDDVAEEQLARFTETGPMQEDIGAEPVAPGRDDTSRVLRRHHTNTEASGSEAVVDGKPDEPRDEEIGDRKADDGTASQGAGREP